MSVCEQTNVSYIDVSPNLIRDPFDIDSPQHKNNVVPLATSSPKLMDSAFVKVPSSSLDYLPDNTSSSTSSDIPPALPRKNRQPLPPPPPISSGRKISTYDNVFLPPASFAGNAFATFQSYNKNEDPDNMNPPNMPPPLPPKKKHIMSYMEMFGRSLNNTDEELVQSLTRTKDLLEAVWQQNYHDYSYNSMSSQYDLSSGGFAGRHRGGHYNDLAHTTFQLSGMGVRPTVLRSSVSSYQLPPPEMPPPPPPPVLMASSQPPSGMPPPFPMPDDEDDNQGDLEDDDDPTTDDIYPPALPPKRGPLSSRSWTGTSGGGTSQPPSHEERIIPIVIEGRSNSSKSGPYRQESTSSAVSASCNTPDSGVNQRSGVLGGHPGSGGSAGGGDQSGRQQYHRFSDSMTSSTSSSGFGTDIHSMRHSLPSPVVEAGTTVPTSQQKPPPPGIEPQPSQPPLPQHTNKQTQQQQPSIKSSSSRKSKTNKETSPLSAKAKRSSSKKKKSTPLGGSVLDQIDVRKACLDMLVYTSSTSDELSKGCANPRASKELLRAGSVDALIVLATQSVKNDFLYQEAFIATYRTFVSTHDLLEKLVQRFRKFNNRKDEQQMIYKRVAHCAFSLMVRVVHGLADCDFQDTSVMELLSDFIAELVNDGELMLARALRTKFIQKYEDRKLRLLPELDTSGLSFSHKTGLLSFKSMDLAEQMTLLDAQLFLRLDSAELILWVQEQNEDKSPNLTKFTEHFNNVSFWCRTKILQQEDPKEREKLVSKFIKIMKELRKHNNFNSYLALLSALDSAPIRRLEWCKSITESLKEHCTLIDSSSSFRAYRQALSSAVAPCIPYVGLVLQDLTFVHIGNPDTFDGKVNFAKRWQQFNILDNLMRFKKKTYNFERKEDISHVFGDFVDYWNEDKMWSVSESIKPRGRRNNSR